MGPRARTMQKHEKGTARRSWEVVTAAGIMMAVLVVLDLFDARQPIIVLSLAPLGLFVIASVRRVSPQMLLLWIAGCGVVSALSWQWRYLGMAYPAAALGVLLIGYRFLPRRG